MAKRNLVWRVFDVTAGFVVGVLISIGWMKKKTRPILITRRTVKDVYKAGR